MKHKRIEFILSTFFIIVVLGFLQVSNTTPNSIKKGSSFKVYMSKKPFDIKIQLSKYTFHLNKDIAVSTKEKIVNSSIVDKIKENNKIYNINKEIIITFNENTLMIDEALKNIHYLFTK
ncbi:hypothetical protein K144313037_18600 [Clostridium tetani]|uniref:hypothetical protein n=1 Tax=Clostridium tetani TaxID=1513 RepID=UPI000D21223A|nr:hypothetical protein [Clostridium tetani]AVP55022.1 hypothetical protein C3B72_07655 [Clostridium tetani]RXI76647.1 hypothetical protein DP128_06015 [Clostridium tetani]WFN61366.1 hypothetical protein PAA20_10610 [Clostridium tetani]SUY56985.1 Uncharacterised protein [Clostridium tetani]BDR70448.1 hypothetical protein K144313037_18600 [Clostridium tetani]